RTGRTKERCAKRGPSTASLKPPRCPAHPDGEASGQALERHRSSSHGARLRGGASAVGELNGSDSSLASADHGVKGRTIRTGYSPAGPRPSPGQQSSWIRPVRWKSSLALLSTSSFSSVKSSANTRERYARPR